MSSYEHVTAKIQRLRDAFPLFKPTTAATKIFVEKMLPLEARRLDSAIEWLIENYKFKSGPSIGDIVARATLRGENLPSAPRDPESRDQRSGSSWFVDASARTVSSDPELRKQLRRDAFDRGVSNAEEHMERMLSDRNLEGCPCMSCTERHAAANGGWR